MRTDYLNVRSCRHCVWMVRLRPRPTFALALDNRNSGAKKKIKTCSVEKSSFIFYFMNQSTRCPLAQCIKSFLFLNWPSLPAKVSMVHCFFAMPVSQRFGHPHSQIPSVLGIPFSYYCSVLGIPRYPPRTPKSLVFWSSPPKK